MRCTAAGVAYTIADSVAGCTRATLTISTAGCAMRDASAIVAFITAESVARCTGQAFVIGIAGDAVGNG